MKSDSDRDSGYVVTIGPSWSTADDWHRMRPDRPFVGVRIERDEVWVVCEPLIAGQPIPGEAREELESLFDQVGREVWTDEQVFLFRAANVGEARRMASQAVSLLRNHGLWPVKPTSADETAASS